MMVTFTESHPARVLIADDHPIFRQGLRLVIEKNPAVEVVAEAENGESALLQIRYLKPDLVFLDIAMPDQDGLSVLEMLRAESNPIRVIMMTSYHEQAYLNRSMDLDVSGYLLKDNSRDDITQCLEQVLQGGTYISPSFSQGNLCIPRDLSGFDQLEELLTEKELQVLALVCKTTARIFPRNSVCAGYISYRALPARISIPCTSLMPKNRKNPNKRGFLSAQAIGGRLGTHLSRKGTNHEKNPQDRRCSADIPFGRLCRHETEKQPR